MANNKQPTDALAMYCETAGTTFTPKYLALPSPKKGEVLVKNLFTTICTSDLHTCLGRRSAPLPSVLGHEIIGEVVALPNSPVLDFSGTALAPGDRITWTVYAHDPSDEMARRGIPQKSAALFKYGHVEALDASSSLSGGFASHCLLRQGTSLFKLPPDLTDAEAAPLNCTHATIAGALRLAGSVQGRRVLVSGVGMLGLSACAMATEAGASVVWAVDPQSERQRRARLFGASQICHPDNIGEVPKVDVLIETSGVPEAMEQGLQRLDIGGVAVLVGAVYTQRDLAINAEIIVRNLLTIKGLHNYTPQDLAAAIRFLTDSRLQYPFQDLVGIRFPLTELDEAVRVADQGPYYRVGIYPNKK
jgi:putative phosphonate catabolism associated alcohol dehydrogenase